MDFLGGFCFMSVVSLVAQDGTGSLIIEILSHNLQIHPNSTFCARMVRRFPWYYVMVKSVPGRVSRTHHVWHVHPCTVPMPDMQQILLIYSFDSDQFRNFPSTACCCGNCWYCCKGTGAHCHYCSKGCCCYCNNFHACILRSPHYASNCYNLFAVR